jgi:hypothetical protein
VKIFGRDIPGHQEERAALRQARRELEQVSEGLEGEETEDYYLANSKVIEAEQNVPWYLR